MEWFRWHHGTATNPKWRFIAVESGQRVADVLAVWALMLERASQNEPRGQIDGWNDKVAAAALDLTPEAVQAIREAMEGLSLNGFALTGWDKRQPKREDGSAERARRWRAQKKREGTQPNATEREQTLEEIRGEEKREEKREKGARTRATQLPDAWEPTDQHRAMGTERSVDVSEEAEAFRDYHLSKGSTFKDWDRAFNNWLRRAKPKPGLRAIKGGLEEYDDSWIKEFRAAGSGG